MSTSHLAVHYLGGDGPTTLYAHATGFHSRCWSSVTAALPGLHNVGYDARGHGDTPIGTDWPSNTGSAPDALDWTVYGRDAALVAHSLSVDGPVLGVGHSMGGAALIMAALAAPEVFCGLVVYEPIVMPPPPDDAPASAGNALADGARRRRASFASFDAAIANYAAKPPMNIFTPDTLDVYVRFGFQAGDDGGGGEVHLKCTPEHEARTYEAGGLHDTWAHLGDVSVPVWVLCGKPEPGQPSSGTAAVAERIPGARYIQLDHLTHFGPMQAPADMAAIVGEAAIAFHARPGQSRAGDPFRAR